MKVPSRFSLSTLLMLSFIVASVLGLAMWRRANVKSEIAALKSEGAIYLTPVEGWVTLSFDREARLVMNRDKSGFSFRGTRYTDADAGERFRCLTERLHAIGVKEVTWWLNIDMPGCTGDSLVEVTPN